MTAGTRRNGTSKFGSFNRAATARFGGSEGQAQDGPGFVEVFGRDEYDIPSDDTGAYAEDGAYGYEEPATQVGPAVDAGDAVQAGHDAEPGRNGKHYAGRHASPRGKTTRKRVGRVVPVAAVAATLAAGTAAAAYGLGGGQLAGGAPERGDVRGLRQHHRRARFQRGQRERGRFRADQGGQGHGRKRPRDREGGRQGDPERQADRRRDARSARPVPRPRPRKAPAAAPATSTSAAATTLSCNLSYSMLPDNVTAIVSFLLANGYSDNAAAGIAGNMYQESKGDPESEGMGGGGLIGFTPLPAGYVTGNPAADLQTQLNAVLTYNQGWASYLPALNAAASPADAAYIYVTDFERAGIPAASTREASAENVASACGI